MLDFLTNSLFFGVAVSLAAYEVGSLLKRKFKSPILNPLLISIILVIVVLVVCKVDYQSYNLSAKYLSYLLTPATVCLAIPLYEQIEKLKSNWKAIIAGIISGIISCVLCVYAFSLIFGLTHEQYVWMFQLSLEASQLLLLLLLSSLVYLEISSESQSASCFISQSLSQRV